MRNKFKIAAVVAVVVVGMVLYKIANDEKKKKLDEFVSQRKTKKSVDARSKSN